MVSGSHGNTRACWTDKAVCSACYCLFWCPSLWSEQMACVGERAGMGAAALPTTVCCTPMFELGPIFLIGCHQVLWLEVCA